MPHCVKTVTTLASRSSWDTSCRNVPRGISRGQDLRKKDTERNERRRKNQQRDFCFISTYCPFDFSPYALKIINPNGRRHQLNWIVACDIQSWLTSTLCVDCVFVWWHDIGLCLCMDCFEWIAIAKILMSMILSRSLHRSASSRNELIARCQGKCCCLLVKRRPEGRVSFFRAVFLGDWKARGHLIEKRFKQHTGALTRLSVMLDDEKQRNAKNTKSILP